MRMQKMRGLSNVQESCRIGGKIWLEPEWMRCSMVSSLQACRRYEECRCVLMMNIRWSFSSRLQRSLFEIGSGRNTVLERRYTNTTYAAKRKIFTTVTSTAYHLSGASATNASCDTSVCVLIYEWKTGVEPATMLNRRWKVREDRLWICTIVSLLEPYRLTTIRNQNYVWCIGLVHYTNWVGVVGV